jgi:hypothetical protein
MPWESCSYASVRECTCLVPLRRACVYCVRPSDKTHPNNDSLLRRGSSLSPSPPPLPYRTLDTSTHSRARLTAKRIVLNEFLAHLFSRPPYTHRIGVPFFFFCLSFCVFAAQLLFLLSCLFLSPHLFVEKIHVSMLELGSKYLRRARHTRTMIVTKITIV